MAVPINVCAANQKIKVNPVYQNSKVTKTKCWKELLYQGISRKEIYFKEKNPCFNKIHKDSKVFNKK